MNICLKKRKSIRTISKSASRFRNINVKAQNGNQGSSENNYTMVAYSGHYTVVWYSDVTIQYGWYCMVELKLMTSRTDG